MDGDLRTTKSESAPFLRNKMNIITDGSGGLGLK